MNGNHKTPTSASGKDGSETRLLRSELRKVLNGNPTGLSSVSGYHLQKKSMLLHLRPRTFPAEAVRFSYTFYLGFLGVFLCAVEVVTGLALMVYYVPTPESAYPSILRIMTEVPFGALLRDIHRLAGEILVAVVVLHMQRTFLTDSYKGRRWFTWMTGVALLIMTLGLAFSGYLLPWDQLAYWAVTIGTSMLEAVPLFGDRLNLLVRGGPEIGADGLLRFYLLHIFLLPMCFGLLLAAHYYRVSRIHGVSKPVSQATGRNAFQTMKPEDGALNFIPDVITSELFRICVLLVILVVWAHFFYDAPIERHADPGRTPLNTQAPWFFLWLQGLLKLGNKAMMGVALPALLVILLGSTPLLDRSPRKPLRRRPFALSVAVFAFIAGMGLTYMGTHRYGISLPPSERILQALAPDEGKGLVDNIPYASLVVGIYETKVTAPDTLPPAFAVFFTSFEDKLLTAADRGFLPEAQGIMIVEDWQAGLKRITLRIFWAETGGKQKKNAERIRHRMEVSG